MSLVRLALAALFAFGVAAAHAQVADWPVTEGAPGGGRFSPLTDITRENVFQAAPGWQAVPGDRAGRPRRRRLTLGDHVIAYTLP